MCVDRVDVCVCLCVFAIGLCARFFARRWLIKICSLRLEILSVQPMQQRRQQMKGVVRRKVWALKMC